jgi:hypothetical protein
MMATLWTPACSMPMSLASVKMKIVAEDSCQVRRIFDQEARGRSGELGLWLCPGELSRLLLACFLCLSILQATIQSTDSPI